MLRLSTRIDRPPSVVWQFCAVDHVANHPRWDPNMELRQLTGGPIGVGTRIARRHTRVGTPVAGTMEVDEFDSERAFGVVIRDATPRGELVVHSRMTLEPEAAGRATRLEIELDVPGSEATMDPSMIEASLARIRQLIESETPPPD